MLRRILVSRSLSLLAPMLLLGCSNEGGEANSDTADGAVGSNANGVVEKAVEGVKAPFVPKIHGVENRAAVDRTKGTLNAISQALMLYSLDNDGYPTGDTAALQKLIDAESGPYLNLNGSPVDGWNNPIQYRFPAGDKTEYAKGDKTPAVWSLGPDGQDDTGDEIGLNSR